MDTTHPKERKAINSHKAKGSLYMILNTWCLHLSFKHHSKNMDIISFGGKKTLPKNKVNFLHVFFFLHDSALLILIYAKKLKGKGVFSGCLKTSYALRGATTGTYQKYGGHRLAAVRPGDHLRAARFLSRHLSGFRGQNDPPQRLCPISGASASPRSHTCRRTRCTCATSTSCSWTLRLMCLFNLRQVSQGKHFPKPFPQAEVFAGAPHGGSPPPAGAARGDRAGEGPRTRFANLTCVSHGPAPAPRDPHAPRAVPAASHAHRAHSPEGPQSARRRGSTSRRHLRSPASAPGAGSALQAGDPGRPRAGRQDAWSRGRSAPGQVCAEPEQAGERGGRGHL